jgi:CDP-paratose 2-epimerase
MSGPTVITGGAGFIGTNMADRLLRQGEVVVVLDDLSRPGVDANRRWLEDVHGDAVRLHVGDVRDPDAVRAAVREASRVFHFAAQVAVTTSVDDPLADAAVNLNGTLTLLEELRRLAEPPPLLFTSTNKVYGGLNDVRIEQRGERYEPEDASLRTHGISERRPLDFCSPYGCSKGAADQYVLDYGKTYGLPTVVFRMSCIYGPHQCGNEDQGWVAHFLMQAMAGRPITLYGDGRQVRDVLFVDDLLDAMLRATGDIDRHRGLAYNMGGGPGRPVSLLELLDLVADHEGRRPQVDFGPWRVGDQRWYVSDTRAFEQASGWRPAVSAADGVRRLHRWLREERSPLRVAEAV